MRKKIIYFCLFIIFVVIYCSGCSASWHVRKAHKKDPSLFETRTVTRAKKMKIPPVSIGFDCYKFLQPATIELYSPILITNPLTGELKTDTVKVYLHTNDTTGYVTAVVDCPDAEVIHETVTEVITLKSTWSEKLNHIIVGVVIGVLAMIVFMNIIKFTNE